MSQYQSMPSGKPKPGWQPSLPPIAGGQSSVQSAQSAQSGASFLSQVPMPYHLSQDTVYGFNSTVDSHAGGSRETSSQPVYNPGFHDQGYTGYQARPTHYQFAQPMEQELGSQQNRYHTQRFDFEQQHFGSVQGTPSPYLNGYQNYPHFTSHQDNQDGLNLPRYAEAARSDSPAGSMTSQQATAGFDSDIVAQSSMPIKPSHVCTAECAPRGSGRNSFSRDMNQLLPVGHPLTRPQRQPYGPKEYKEGENFALRARNSSGFNPTAPPYAPRFPGHSGEAQQEANPGTPSRPLSRPASRNSVAEARRDSHDTAVSNALAYVSLSTKASRSSLQSGSSAKIPNEDELGRMASYTNLNSRDSYEDTTPTRPISRDSRQVSTAPSGKCHIDFTLGAPPSFVPGELTTGSHQMTTPQRPSSAMGSAAGGGLSIIGVGSDPFTATEDTPKRLRTVRSSVEVRGSPAISTPVSQSDLFTPLQRRDTIKGSLHNTSPRRGPSPHLAMIVGNNNIKPVVEVAFQPYNLPFITSARSAAPSSPTGLVRISNIPYSVTRQEIIAFIGRNARILKDSDEPVHIIMERVTSKTMDAFVEFVSANEAINCVSRYELNRTGGRGGRLGERHVDLEVVGHEQLMKDLFPKAKNIQWQGAVPVITEHDPNDPYNSGFQGFIIREELVMLVKHVETPQRSPFAKDCPQRPFECLISTLCKYPWYKVDYISIEDRDVLFNCTKRLVELLCTRLAEAEETISIDHRLLNRVKRACFLCPGFSESQKDDIAYICGLSALEAGLVPYADHWHVFKAIGPKPGIAADVLAYYQALLREATTSVKILSLADMAESKSPTTSPSIFGSLKIDYPDNVELLSISEVARIEWEVIEELLRKVLFDESRSITAY